MCKRSKGYDKDVLKSILHQLSISNNNLQEAVTSSETGNFFDSNGHIHGGGWYANSRHGIAIWQFDENVITVYNNFEGTLYEVKGLEYEVKYENTDYEVNNAINAVNSYVLTSDDFDKTGVLSPSKKMKSIFFWGTSMIHYFTIRTLDNSRPDFNVPAPAGEYRWLTDDYILYLNAWTSAPYVVRVSDDMQDDGSVNVMYVAGIFEKDDYFQDSAVNYSIKDIKDSVITFYDEEVKKTYKVQYSIGEDKKIRFELIN